MITLYTPTQLKQVINSSSSELIQHLISTVVQEKATSKEIKFNVPYERSLLMDGPDLKCLYWIDFEYQIRPPVGFIPLAASYADIKKIVISESPEEYNILRSRAKINDVQFFESPFKYKLN